MTVQRIVNPSLRYFGLSTDTKPAAIEGSLFHEFNPAGQLLGLYEMRGGVWVLLPDQREALEQAERERDALDVQARTLAVLERMELLLESLVN